MMCYALQEELKKADAKLQALQSEMQKLQSNAEELGRKLKAMRNDMQQAQKESQVGHVNLCLLHPDLRSSSLLAQSFLSCHCPFAVAAGREEGMLCCVAA